MLKISILICSVIIIILTLLQGGDSNGLSGFTGRNELKLFETSKERGSEKVIMYITGGTIALFLLLVFLFNIGIGG